jgi:rhamnulokinase
MPLNTLYQLAAESTDRWNAATQLLLIGDGFNRFLSGRSTAEVTLASTSMLYNPRRREWSEGLIERLGFPRSLFPPLVQAGTRLGPLRESLARATGLEGVEVVATCSHDTGAAVAAVPASGSHWAYLSSGTWSLMGVEIQEPIITDRARELNFTNEIGLHNTVRLLKNISGLWLLQECRRKWTLQDPSLTYATLTQLATEAPPFGSLVQPGDPAFLAPDDMPARLQAYCRDHGEPVPESPGSMVRCILESLALLYRRTREQLEELTGEPIRRLHIVGGGSQNALLNQFAANALQVPVIAGPVEATTAGNLLVQAEAMGLLQPPHTVRSVVAESFEVQTFEPRDREAWDRAYDRFRAFH